MRLTISDATSLAQNVMVALGYTQSQAKIATDHLIDSELRGLTYAGFSRILSIADHLARKGLSNRAISIMQETPVSARLDGADNLGYLVAQRATEIAIEKASAGGIAIVGASDTWYTGMLSYYAEQVVARDLVVMIASNASPWVAPHGGTEGRFGTNPICFGFPSADKPVIWDIGTSSIIHAQAVLAKRLGRPLPDGTAFGPDGRPTTDPETALAGAFTPWGGHRGSGLALVVHLLGMLAGSPMMPGELEGFGYLAIAVKPDLLTPLDAFKREVAAYSELVRETRPADPNDPVRMPFDRSRADRDAQKSMNFIEIPDPIHAAVLQIADGKVGERDK
ncbi:Ldh family oxidoreductase [Limoniibacter endophyticus]|uniref:Sulfolactate dehydrogenase n=1 Tax=Limoniibacter endophyticus TaxID=1565040 RepID=A0A8J3DSK4_9HYPH|nr:Ldh family oxidoreductase [Limoniibacter endophyticus]GHC78101.1 sulfolactate dehydrogenase [Limoniibacter endophyticus]